MIEVSEVRSQSGMRTRREHEIRAMMAKVFENHRVAKAAFVKSQQDGQLLGAFGMRPMLKAQADVIPWMRVQRKVTEGTSIYLATMQIRSELVRALLDYGEASMSDPLAMEIERVERDGMRRFIRATARFTDETVAVPVLNGSTISKPDESDE